MQQNKKNNNSRQRGRKPVKAATTLNEPVEKKSAFKNTGKAIPASYIRNQFTDEELVDENSHGNTL